MSNLVVIDHPLVAHKLSLVRDKTTPSAQFRSLLREISLLLGYEVLRDLPTELRDIETPVGPTRAPFLKRHRAEFASPSIAVITNQVRMRQKSARNRSLPRSSNDLWLRALPSKEKAVTLLLGGR